MPNVIHSRIDTGGVALGLIVRVVRSAEIARIARATGHDFIFIDTQHAVFSGETVADILVAARDNDLAGLVRLRRHDDANASLFLDAGAAGIIAPNVDTAEQARHLVETCRFPPRGQRSLPGPLFEFGLRDASARESMDRADAETVIVCMIETLDGLANVDAIAAVDGVDVLHVGCVDLLLALGRPGEPDCRELRAAIDRVARAARANGKILGVGGDRDPVRRAGYIRDGARFMTTETDIAMLVSSAATAVSSIRDGFDA